MKRGAFVLLGIAVAVLMLVWWRGTSHVEQTERGLAAASALIAQARDRESEGRLQRLADEPSAVRGWVVAAEGIAVDGAVVALRTPLPMRAPNIEPFVAITDTDGRWSVAELPPGPYDLSVTRSGYRSAFEPGLELEPGTERTGVQTVLAVADDNFTGRVVDGKGNPIPRARVEVTPKVDKYVSSPRTVSTLTDERGGYRLAVTSGRYAVHVVHHDYVTKISSVLVFGRKTQDFTLIPGGTIEGRVLDRDKGTPVGGAAVSLISAGPERLTTLVYAEEVRSDAEGRFTLHGVPAGVVFVEAIGPGFASVQPTSVPLGVGEQVQGVEVLVERARTLSGYIVFDDAENEGVPGMAVGVLTVSTVKSRTSAPTNAEGYFEIHGLRPGSYSLLVLGSNGVPGRVSMHTMGESDISDALLRVQRGRFVRGRVEPGMEATLHLTYRVQISSDGERQARMSSFISGLASTSRLYTSAPDGTFTIGPVAAASFELTAVSEDGHVGRQLIDVRDGDANNVALPLRPGLELEGRLVDGSGRPIQGGIVVLHRQVEAWFEDFSTLVAAPGTVVVSDDRGNFRFGGLTPGTYSYSVVDERLVRQPWVDPSPDGSTFAPRHMVLDRSRDDVELRIASSHTLRGQVFDPSGHAASDAWVIAWPELPLPMLDNMMDSGIKRAGPPEQDEPSQWRRLPSRSNASLTWIRHRELASPPVLTDEQGRFSIPGLRFGSYNVLAESERGALRADVRGVDPSVPFDVHLEALGSLEGTVGGGQSADGVVAIYLMGPERAHVFLREGLLDFEIPRLRPGRYEVLVMAPGGAHRSEVEISAGQTTVGPFPLQAYSTVRGRIIDVSTGRPIGALRVTRYVSERWSFREQDQSREDLFNFDWDDDEVVVDAQGEFELREIVPDMATTLVFREPSSERVIAQLSVEPPAGARVDVGDIKGMSVPEVPPVEQGTLGLEVWVIRPEGGAGIVEVSGVRKGLPASSAGVSLGDRIVGINDRSTAELGPLTSRQLLLPSALRVGDERSLVIERDTERLEIDLVAVRLYDGG